MSTTDWPNLVSLTTNYYKQQITIIFSHCLTKKSSDILEIGKCPKKRSV